MKRKSDTYIEIYNKYRHDQENKIAELTMQVRNLTRMVEFLAAKVFE